MYLETNRVKIERRLRREGWTLLRHGRKHDIFSHPDPEKEDIHLPRHRVVSMFVARTIARVAGWPG